MPGAQRALLSILNAPDIPSKRISVVSANNGGRGQRRWDNLWSHLFITDIFLIDYHCSVSNDRDGCAFGDLPLHTRNSVIFVGLTVSFTRETRFLTIRDL